MWFSDLWSQILYSPDEGDGAGGGAGGSDDNGDGDSQDDGDQDEDADSEGDDQDEDPYKDLTPEQLKARLTDREGLVGKLRKESKGRRLKLKKIEDAEAKRKKEEMTEVEKATAEKVEADKKVVDAEAELKTLKIERVVESAALKAGVAPKRVPIALRLIDLDDVEIDEDGNVDEKAVVKAIKALVKEMPELLGKPKPDLESEDGEDGGDQIKIDEEELRASFGLRPGVKEKK